MAFTDEVSLTEHSAAPEGSLRAFGATLLGMLVVTAFAANLFLAVAVVASATLRRCVFYVLVVNLALVNVADTAVNMLLALLYIASGRWLPGAAVCVGNAAVVELAALETVGGVALLAVDRAVALLDLDRYERRMSPLNVAVALGGVWFVGVCLVAPVAIRSVPSALYPARYFCAAAAGTPLGYVLALLAAHLAAMFLVLLAFGVILLAAHKERVRETRGFEEDDHTDLIKDYRIKHEQLDMGKFVVCLFVVYFVLQGPYLIMTFLLQARNSEHGVDSYGDQVKLAPDAETAITWFKFVYPVVFPFIVFAFNHDVWMKLTSLLCCRRTNVVTLAVGQPIPECLSGGQEPDELKVMTLVATDEGVRLRPRGQRRSGIDELAFADVGVQAQRPLPADPTSDYDSAESESLRAHGRREARRKRSSVAAEVSLGAPESAASQSHVRLQEDAPSARQHRRDTRRHQERSSASPRRASRSPRRPLPVGRRATVDSLFNNDSAHENNKTYVKPRLDFRPKNGVRAKRPKGDSAPINRSKIPVKSRSRSVPPRNSSHRLTR